MRDERIRGCRPRSYTVTTDSSHNDETVSNVLNRDFAPTAANVAWVSDITYIRTWSGWLYLAVIIDLYSRRVVGWSIDDHMRTELVIEALESAAGSRPTQGVIHHSDRGSQYTSGEYRSLMSRLGMTVSMSKVTAGTMRRQRVSLPRSRPSSSIDAPGQPGSRPLMRSMSTSPCSTILHVGIRSPAGSAQSTTSERLTIRRPRPHKLCVNRNGASPSPMLLGALDVYETVK